VGPLVRRLLAIDRDSRYRLILRRGWLAQDSARELEELGPVVPVRVPDRVLFLWWDRLGWSLPLPRNLWGSFDLFLAVYDLIPLRVPELFPERERFRQQVERLVRRSAAVIAISHRTRQDLIELVGVDPARVRVIYPGRGEAFHPIPAAEAAAVAERYGIRGRYLLYVGSLGPHKNVATLLYAYERARLEGGLTTRLVVVGSPRWGRETLAVLETLRIREDILLIGPVPAADLPALYAGADCFVFPSRYEGFGLPVLEAMACGTPVIVSDRGALPEVVGEAGILVNPEKPEALADALGRVTRDPELRTILAKAGLAQAARFSWDQSTASLLTLLHDVAGRGEDGA
jgi:glycosyltransferase involved in cell wall biosynthesis